MTPRTACLFCGEAIEKPRGNRRYCSNRCKQAANRSSVCSCGAPKSKVSKRCLPCSLEDRRQKRSAHRSRIEYLWAEGLTQREIAADLGLTLSGIQVEVARMRATGWKVPYRRKPRAAAPADAASCRIEFHTAVEHGKIRRPKRCEECGEVGHVDGHHEDYSKPLYVVWLCRACHMNSHGALRKATA